jgi:hypothetical protein
MYESMAGTVSSLRYPSGEPQQEAVFKVKQVNEGMLPDEDMGEMMNDKIEATERELAK